MCPWCDGIFAVILVEIFVLAVSYRIWFHFDHYKKIVWMLYTQRYINKIESAIDV